MKQRIRDFLGNMFSHFNVENSRWALEECLTLEMRIHGIPAEYRQDAHVIIHIARHLPITPADLIAMYCHIYHKGRMDLDDFLSFRYHGVPLFRKETKELWKTRRNIPFKRFREELLSLVSEGGVFYCPLI